MATATQKQPGARAGSGARPEPSEAPRDRGGPDADTLALLDPFVPGSWLGSWLVVRAEPVADGAASVVLRDGKGIDFQLDIYARDTGPRALRPPGRSVKFDVFLANGGTGALASNESHGLAAMAVADVLRQNETRLDCSAFVTLRTRLASSSDSVRRRV